MENVLKEVANILTNAKDQVNTLLGGDPIHESHRLRIVNGLQSQINTMSLLHDTHPQEGSVQPIGMQQAKTILGEPIRNSERVTELSELKPDESKVYQLEKNVNDAYDKLHLVTNEWALGNIDPLVIRGVAKKAGLQVTSSEPAQITLEFIQQIKEAINSKQVEEANRMDEKHDALKQAVTDAQAKVDEAKGAKTDEEKQAQAAAKAALKQAQTELTEFEKSL